MKKYIIALLVLAGLLSPTLFAYTNPLPYNLSYVVRLLAGGTPDPSFTECEGGTGQIHVTVESGDKIFCGGEFTSFDGIIFRNIGRYNSDGSSDTSWNAGSGTDGAVNTIAVQSDGQILIGGSFSTVQGLSRPFLARLTDGGALDTSFQPSLGGSVDDLSIEGDGTIVVNGSIRLQSDGSPVPTSNPPSSVYITEDQAAAYGWTVDGTDGQGRQHFYVIDAGNTKVSFSIDPASGAAVDFSSDASYVVNGWTAFGVDSQGRLHFYVIDSGGARVSFSIQDGNAVDFLVEPAGTY